MRDSHYGGKDAAGRWLDAALPSPHRVHTMNYEWDERKRAATLADRGLDFADARSFFDGRPVVITPSPRGSEARFAATAAVEGVLLTLIWTWRGDTLRVITMRRAHAKEEKQYRQLYRQGA
jgi:uncharacterized DUF497 family protein